MAKNNKKYEVTIDGLAVDFFKALTGTSEYNENYCNSFTNLIHIVTRPGNSDHMKEVHERTERELYCRAYNYICKGMGLCPQTGSTFAQAFIDKILTYRQAS